MDESMLTYMITAHDLASPVFRAFSAQVDAMSKSVQASLKEMNAQLLETQRRMAALGDSAGANATKTDVAATSAASAAGATATLGGAHADTSAAVDDATKSLDAHKQSLEDVIAAATAVNAKSVQVETEEGKVKVAFNDATKEVEKHKGAFDALIPAMGVAGERVEQVHNKLTMFKTHGVDYAAAGIVGLEAAFAGFGVKSSIEFDNMNKEIQAQTGVTAKKAQELVAIAQQVGSKVPVSFSEISTAIGAEYKLFGNNLNLIKANTDGMLAFANQAGGGTQQTIQQLSAIMRNFHPAGQNVVDVMDDLTRLSQKAQQPLGNYMTLISKYGPQLKAMGLSFNETTGLMDEFSKRGVSSTQMARGMQTALSFATKAVHEQQSALQYQGKGGMDPYTKAVLAARDALETLKTSTLTSGETTKEYDDKLWSAQNTLKTATDRWIANKQVVDMATKAHDNLGKIIQQESVNIAHAKGPADALNLSLEYFGSKLGPSMAKALYGQRDGLDAFKNKLGDTKGAIEQLAATERDTMTGQMQILENQFTVISATVGKDLLPAMKDVVGILHTVATGIEQFSTGGTADIAKVTAGFLGISSVVLLATRHIGLLSSAVKSVTTDGSKLQNLLAGKNANPVKSSTPSASATESPMSTLVGFGGKPDMVGSEMNPIAVQVVGEGMGGPGEDSEPVAESPIAQGAATAEEESPAMLGAAGGTTSTVERAAGEAAPLEAELTAGSVLSMGNIMKGGMIAFAGATASHILGGVIGGTAGKDVSKIGTDAAVGAGVGSFLGPEGTVVGGLAGAGVGALTSIFGGGGDTTSATLAKMDAAIKQAASDDNINKLRTLRDAAADMGKQLQGVDDSGSKAFTDLANKLSTAIPQMTAQAQNAADMFSGPMQAALTQIAGSYGFPAVTRAVNNTSDSVQQKSALVVAALKNIADSGTGPMAKNAQTALDQLKATTTQDMTAMSSQVVSSMATLKTEVQDGSQTAAQQAQTNMNAFAAAVKDNMDAGVTSAGAGIQQIINTLNTALRALGQAPLSLAQVAGLDQSAGIGVTTGPGRLAVGATGTRVPGAVGPDSWTLLDPSGRPAAKVAGGELLVSNRHTEAKVNAMLPDGVTLGGLVAGETTPHSAPGMATGGFINAPAVTGGGDVGQIVSKGLAVIASAANAKVSGSSSTAGSGAFTGSLSGPIEKQVYQFFSANGFNKIAIAGMLGNALQESSMNPNTPGGGLWQQISNFGSGTGGSLLHQMQTMLPQIMSLRNTLNSAGSAELAAQIFMTDFERPRVSTENLARREGGASAAYAAGYARGGRMAYAGAFGNGGSFTASGPTIGLFGEKGIEHVTAVPGYATGGTVADITAQLNHTLAAIPYTAATSAATAAARATKAEVPSQHIDPFTGKMITDTATQFSALTLQYQLHTKAMSKVVTDTLVLDGLILGTIQTTRATLKKAGLPDTARGGDVDVSASLLGKTTQSGMSSLQSAFSKSLQQDAVPHLVKIANSLTGEGGSKLATSREHTLAGLALTAASTRYGTGVTNTENQYQHELTIQGIIEAMPKGTSAKKLGLSGAELKASGLTYGGVKRMAGTVTSTETSGSVFALQEKDAKDEDSTLKSEEAKTSKLYQAALKDHQTKLAASLKTQLDSITQARLTADADVTASQVSAIDAAVQAVQDKTTKATTASSLATSIQGLAAGSHAGISAAVLKTLGISGTTTGQTGLAAASAANSPLLAARTSDIAELNKLQNSIQGLSGPALTETQNQMATLAGTIVSLDGTIQSNLVTSIDNLVAVGTAAAQKNQDSSDIITSIEGLTPGTNLASIGLSDSVLSAYGLTPGQAQSLEGTAGTLTGTQAVNQGLSAEIGTDQGTLSQLEASLPSLSGSALTEAQTQITALVKAILGLQGTIQQNTQAVTASTASTSSTGQLTGSVGYTYQNENFVAGAMSSDSASNVGVGL